MVAWRARGGGQWVGCGSKEVVGQEPLQAGLKERTIYIHGERYTVLELENTTDLLESWLQGQVECVSL